MTTKHLTAELLLKTQNRRFTSVPMPDLGGELRIGSFSAHTGVALNQLNERLSKGEDVAIQRLVILVAGSVVDDVGRPLFTEATARQWIEVVAVETLRPLLESITKLNGAQESPNPTAAGQS